MDTNNKEEANAIAKQCIQDRDVTVDEENTCQVEDKDVIKEIEENEKRTDKEEARAAAKPKNICLKNRRPPSRDREFCMFWVGCHKLFNNFPHLMVNCE